MAFDYTAKLGALLLQAEKAATAEEADAFMKLAQKLSTTHQIDLEVARQHQADKTKREQPVQKRISIGERRKRGLFTFVRLFLNIAEANDVKCNIAHDSTAVYAFGFPSDIEVVEALYASLVQQMVEASDAYIRSAAFKQDKVWGPIYETVEDWYGRKRRELSHYGYKPVHATTARVSFQEAFASRVGYRLAVARREAIAEAEKRQAEEREALLHDAPELAAEGSTESTGAELVLANKALEVSDFYKRTSNARGSWKGGAGVGRRSSHAQGAGREAGSRARLGGERAITSGQRQIAG